MDAEEGQAGRGGVDGDEAACVQPIRGEDRQTSRQDAVRGEDEPRFVGAQVAVAPVQAVEPNGQGQDGQQQDGDDGGEPGGRTDRHPPDDAAAGAPGANKR
jgi:hypothetical protein